MNEAPLVEVEPKELRFIFELKKQSSCSVQVTNNTHHYVAYKVKTTAPKIYSVRPNVGVLMPKSTSGFIVTMQAQRVAPADMVCKDKFLIQSTIVPAETTDEDVTSSLFVKDGGRYVEENKLKVALISPSNSPEFSPTSINGDFKNALDHEKDQIFSKDEIQSPKPMVFKNLEHNVVDEKLKLEEDTELKPEPDMRLNNMKVVEEPEKESELKLSKHVEFNMKVVEEPEKDAELKLSKDMELNMVKDVEEFKLEEETEVKLSTDLELNTVSSVEEKVAELIVTKDLELNTVKNVEELRPENEAESKVSKGMEELKLMEAIKEMKLKLDRLESKFNESGVKISKLTEERRISNQETKILQEKLAYMINEGPRKVQVGFPLLYVCMVALICIFFGYHLHS